MLVLRYNEVVPLSNINFIELPEPIQANYISKNTFKDILRITKKVRDYKGYVDYTIYFSGNTENWKFIDQEGCRIKPNCDGKWVQIQRED